MNKITVKKSSIFMISSLFLSLSITPLQAENAKKQEAKIVKPQDNITIKIQKNENAQTQLKQEIVETNGRKAGDGTRNLLPTKEEKAITEVLAIFEKIQAGNTRALKKATHALEAADTENLETWKKEVETLEKIKEQSPELWKKARSILEETESKNSEVLLGIFLTMESAEAKNTKTWREAFTAIKKTDPKCHWLNLFCRTDESQHTD